MVLWRISRHRGLSGKGGLRASGRWHQAGHPIVYVAETPSAALLEVCVHITANDVPPEFTLMRIEEPAPQVLPVIKVPMIELKDLPANWTALPEVTRDIGTAWLQRNTSPLLKVPSALVPATANYLFNPLHVDAAKFRIAEVFWYPFQFRLKK